MRRRKVTGALATAATTMHCAVEDTPKLVSQALKRAQTSRVDGSNFAVTQSPFFDRQPARLLA